jgi:hypothetical protein
MLQRTFVLHDQRKKGPQLAPLPEVAPYQEARWPYDMRTTPTNKGEGVGFPNLYSYAIIIVRQEAVKTYKVCTSLIIK